MANDRERFERLLKTKQQKEADLQKLAGQLEEKKKEKAKKEQELFELTGTTTVEDAKDSIEKDKKQMEDFMIKAEEILRKYEG